MFLYNKYENKIMRYELDWYMNINNIYLLWIILNIELQITKVISSRQYQTTGKKSLLQKHTFTND